MIFTDRDLEIMEHGSTQIRRIVTDKRTHTDKTDYL